MSDNAFVEFFPLLPLFFSQYRKGGRSAEMNRKKSRKWDRVYPPSLHSSSPSIPCRKPVVFLRKPVTKRRASNLRCHAPSLGGELLLNHSYLQNVNVISNRGPRFHPGRRRRKRKYEPHHFNDLCLQLLLLDSEL